MMLVLAEVLDKMATPGSMLEWGAIVLIVFAILIFPIAKWKIPAYLLVGLALLLWIWNCFGSMITDDHDLIGLAVEEYRRLYGRNYRLDKWLVIIIGSPVLLGLLIGVRAGGARLHQLGERTTPTGSIEA